MADQHPPWHRVVVKVGTSTLTAGTGRLNPPRMVDFVRQISVMRNQGTDVVLVSSGAQQAGRERLGPLCEGQHIPTKQMLAAVGQARLMHLWEEYFQLFAIISAQVLLTRQDVEDRSRYLNVRDTFESLLERRIVPIVNENDAVATEEIKVGENDTLSAMVSNLVEADLLVLLSDIDGLYSADPAVDNLASLISRVDHIDSSIYELAGASKSGLGTGGMYTKILAADMAVHSGTSVAIANGGRENILASLAMRSQPCTWFPASITPAEGRKRWLLAQKAVAGSVVVDEGAVRAILQNGKSLLPVGISQVRGEFERGALIGVLRSGGQEIARGLGNYSSSDLKRILGRRSTGIADILGFDYGPEVIHRDKMVIL
jgi:glutamate 5-kinase